MRKLLRLFLKMMFLSLWFTSYSSAINIDGDSSKKIRINNLKSSSVIFFDTSKGWKQIYQQTSVYQKSDKVSVNKYGEFYSIIIPCNTDSCRIIVNAKTGEFSAPATNLIDFSDKLAVGVYYLEKEKKLIFKPLFSTCQNPLIIDFSKRPWLDPLVITAGTNDQYKTKIRMIQVPWQLTEAQIKDDPVVRDAWENLKTHYSKDLSLQAVNKERLSLSTYGDALKQCKQIANTSLDKPELLKYSPASKADFELTCSISYDLCDIYFITNQRKRVSLFSAMDMGLYMNKAWLTRYNQHLGVMGTSCGSPCNNSVFIDFEHGLTSEAYENVDEDTLDLKNETFTPTAILTDGSIKKVRIKFN